MECANHEGTFFFFLMCLGYFWKRWKYAMCITIFVVTHQHNATSAMSKNSGEYNLLIRHCDYN
jgi:hypothetical protein